MSVPVDVTGLNWQMVGAIAAIVAVIVGFVAWRWPRGDNGAGAVLGIRPFVNTDYPNIHATNGVPSLDQLLAGVTLDPKGLHVAMELYSSGLAQFNHYLNNLGGVVKEAQLEKRKLEVDLADDELALAEEIGSRLASGKWEERRNAQSQFDDLSATAQLYAGYKHCEYAARKAIASALRHDLRITDFTSVKERIASGDVPLSAVVTELPITWQDITAMHRKAGYQEPKEKPPKRERIHAIFMAIDTGVLEDKRVERDGEWMISEKHDFLVPYQKPAPMLRFKDPGQPPVPTGKYVAVVNQQQGIEWDFKFWRRDGYLDSVYQRSKKGLMPDQLRKASRRRRIRIVGWTVGTVILAADVVLLASKLL